MPVVHYNVLLQCSLNWLPNSPTEIKRAEIKNIYDLLYTSKNNLLELYT